MEQKLNKLETGSIGKLLFSLALPSVTAQLINMLYNIVDRIYIGNMKSIGDVALTGVGLTMPIILIISAFSNLIGMGGSPRASIKLGEGKKEEAEKILGNCFTALIIIALVLTPLFLIFSEDLMKLFGASSETLPYGLSYLRIYVLGTVFVQLALGLNPFISTQGFAKVSMLTVVIGAITNIILDPILIFGFGMGVEGAAIATVLSQMLSATFVLWFLYGKKTKLKIRLKYMKLRKSTIIPVLLLGLSPFVMTSTESILNIAFNTSLYKYGGDVAVGAMTILSSIIQMLTLPVLGVIQGAQPIISYNFGAKNIDRVKKTFKLLFKICMVYSVIFWILVMLFPKIPITLFNKQQELVSMTVWALRIYMATSFVLGAQFVCQQTFIALGQAKVSLLLALLRKVILLIPLIYILPIFLQDKVFAVFLAEPIADFLAALTTVIIFSIRFNKILDERMKKGLRANSQ